MINVDARAEKRERTQHKALAQAYLFVNAHSRARHAKACHFINCRGMFDGAQTMRDAKGNLESSCAEPECCTAVEQHGAVPDQ
ncbi:MAG: hypothetical protein Q8R69_03440 [Telluria sp.]|nr:hypothetical protein [Telluria sp.]